MNELDEFIENLEWYVETISYCEDDDVIEDVAYLNKVLMFLKELREYRTKYKDEKIGKQNDSRN